jgi:hypothetical protein
MAKFKAWLRFLRELVAFIAPSVIGIVGVIALAFGLATVVNYYLWNFLLSVFNTGYQLSWLQAVGVSFVMMILKNRKKYRRK